MMLKIDSASNTTPYSSIVAGFSIIELLIALSILAIIASFTAPSYSSIVNTSKLESTSKQYVTHITFGRSEAVKRNQIVGICTSRDTITCDGTAEWHDGWLMWVDNNANNDIDENEQILKQSHGNPIHITFNTNERVIAFNSRGLASTSGVFAFCKTASDNNAIGLKLSTSGRLKTLPEESSITC